MRRFNSSFNFAASRSDNKVGTVWIGIGVRKYRERYADRMVFLGELAPDTIELLAKKERPTISFCKCPINSD